MGDLVDLGVQRCLKGIGDLYADAAGIVSEYRDLAIQNPPVALEQFDLFLDRNRSDIEGLCGGPNYDFTCPIINILGFLYLTFERDQRKTALKKVLTFLDHTKNTYSQWQMEKLHNPTLVGDVLANRMGLYWPGCADYSKFMEDTTTLDKNFEAANSRFLFAFSVIAVEWSHSTLPVRRAFYRAYPNFVDETLSGIAAMTFGSSYYASRVSNKSKPNSKEYNNSRRFANQFHKRLQRYDPEVHQKIIDKVKEGHFILFDRFHHNYKDADISDKLFDSIP